MKRILAIIGCAVIVGTVNGKHSINYRYLYLIYYNNSSYNFK